jgi:pimeloyl-ACP methyl ester carboxylesterase
MSGTAFREGSVEADGLRIRYREAGDGIPLVHLHGADGPLTAAHDLLCRHFRVLVVDMPGAGSSSGQSLPELASTIAHALSKIGVDGFNLLGTSSGGETALWIALQAPERVRALVLEAPAAIRHDGADLEGRLEELTTPTLVLCGTRDTVSPPAMGRGYKERIPNCHLVFVYDAGQAIGVDRPEAFTEVVADFFERHEAFVISRTPTVIHP